jgi:hypothetical protein
MKRSQLLLFISIVLFSISCKNAEKKKNHNTSEVLIKQTNNKQSLPEQGSQQKDTGIKKSDCVRSTPEPVVKKAIFPHTNFQLQKDSLVGIETVNFDNGDKLIIHNWGCEYYVLTFRFETSYFQADTTDMQYWYKQGIQFMNMVEKAIDTPVDLPGGINAIKAYIKKTSQPKLGEELNYGEPGNDIGYMVTVDRVQKITDKMYAIEMSFSVGPL